MNLNVIRLRNIVNKERSFYDNQKELDTEEDPLNKYDSDEDSQQNESSSEEDNQIEVKDGNDTSEDNETQSLKSKLNEDTANSLTTYTRSIDMNNMALFTWKEDDPYTDAELITLINSFNMTSELNTAYNAFLDKLYQSTASDLANKEMILFYSSIFTFFLRKVFCYIKCSTSFLPQIIQSFNSINQIAISLIQKCQILPWEDNSNSSLLIKQISLSIIQLCDYILELFSSLISIEPTIDQPKSFISLSLKYIQSFIISTKFKPKKRRSINRKDKEYEDEVSIYIRKYIETIAQLIIVDTKQNTSKITVSIEELKSLFSLSFILLTKDSYSNSFITLIDIICFIVEMVNESSFEEKFIDNLLLCFDEFLTHYDYSNEKFKYYIWNKQVLRNYSFYFGEYNCLNSERSISLFTYLFLRFYSVMFTKEDFIKTFEMFLVKLFEWTKPGILLCLCCLMNDLLKIKYNVEFTITLIIITNVYLSVSNLVSQSELELNKRKLLINLMEVFFIDLLNEFDGMKLGYLCLGKEEDQGKKNKDKNKDKGVKKGNANKSHIRAKCDCFSCDYTIKKKNYFNCKQCKCKTNLRLQLIDPDKDDNQSICGFCNMRSFFENSGMLFEKEQTLKLIDTNEDLIEEYSKSKQKQELLLLSKGIKGNSKVKGKDKESTTSTLNNSIESHNTPINFFDKFVYYQELLYQNAFLFLKLNIINFIRLSNTTENKKISINIDNSFKIFLKILINDQKMKTALYKNFTQSVIQFYTVQKERLFNLHQDIQIDDITVNYFFFFHFYVNFLFAGHWKIIDLILNDKSHWTLRYKGLKILEKFILFEGPNRIIFQNFEIGLIAPLLSDNSLNIREYSLDILFKLYKNGRIERGHLIYILYENINESSFLIRKRIIKALSGLIIEERERGDNLRTIITIFLNKLNDNSESVKIKKMIYDFFTNALRSSIDELKYAIVDIVIELLKENEDLITGTNALYENVKDVIDNVSVGIGQSVLTAIIDYLIEKYFFNKKRKGEEVLQALNVIRVISHHENESVLMYIEYINDRMMKHIKHQGSNTTLTSIAKALDNRIIQITCDILSKLFDERSKESIRIKSSLVNVIESNLIEVILTKPCFVMTAAIEVYFKMIHRGLINADKMNLLTIQNYNFLNKYYKDKTQCVDDSGIPEIILSKSLSLLSYIIYSIKEDNVLMTIFNNKSLNEITNDIFNILVYYTVKNKNSIINFRAFESLGFFWIRYPSYLNQSTDVINHVINNLTSEEDKAILLRTFYQFFTKISFMISSINKDKKKVKAQGNRETFDFGIIHLFFERFINKFSSFLISETSVVIRTHAIHLIRLIIELGNVNVHNVLPHIFASLFDINAEIRYIAVCLIEKILHISKEKFFSLIKECLKSSYSFHKTFYVNSQYFTSFVKERMSKTSNKVRDNTFRNTFYNTNENVFELLYYKSSKNDKSHTLQKRLLEKFLFAFSEITTLENSFTSSTSSSSLSQLRDSIEQFEYYEYIAHLIGDFKYTDANEVLFVYDKLYSSFETNYCVFKSKVKQYKNIDTPIKPLDNKDTFYFLQCGVQSALLKFLILKYDIISDDAIEIVKRKGWNTYREELAEGTDNELNDSVKIKTRKAKAKTKSKKRVNLIFGSKEFYGIQFYEFYIAFNDYFKKLIEIQMRSKFNRRNQINTIELLSRLKAFNNMKISQIRRLICNAKKKSRKESSEVIYELFFSLDNGNGDVDTKMIDYTEVKLKKRIRLECVNENENRKDNDEKLIGKTEKKRDRKSNSSTKSDEEGDESERKVFKKKKKKYNRRITIQ